MTESKHTQQNYEEVLGLLIDEGDFATAFRMEATQNPFLSAEEEYDLTIKIQQGRNAKARLESPRSMSGVQKRRLQSQLSEGLAAQNTLVMSHTWLVFHIAGKFNYPQIDPLDLVQEGNKGLVQAASNCKPCRDTRFSGYAKKWIKGCILSYLTEQSRSMKLSKHTVSLVKKCRQVEHNLETTLGRKPLINEIAAAIEVAPEKIAHSLAVSQSSLSINPVTQEIEDTTVSQIADPDFQPIEERIYHQQLRQLLNDELNELDEYEAMILRLRFGLINGYQYTREEVAQIYNLEPRQIKLIEEQVLEKLRYPQNPSPLHTYYTS